uniref:Uncharacterized protein n=1 Tax=Glossina morsitans morsitans TaxID=37546 RepID=A0A1B0FG33_GLOMM
MCLESPSCSNNSKSTTLSPSSSAILSVRSNSKFKAAMQSDMNKDSSFNVSSESLSTLTGKCGEIQYNILKTLPRRDKRSEEMPPKMNRKRKAPNEHIVETKSLKLENSSLNTDYSRSSCEEIS